MSVRLEPGDPERIGELWLAGRLGAGGRGVVYDAYGPDGARVAVKVLHGAQESPGELARMAAEARAAQRVASFCTARILQVRLEPPRPYIVSEYIDGLSLQDTVNSAGDRPGRRFAGDDLHRLGMGIATALAAIHQAKVVHRDLKPGNMMLGPDGPRLIDFGIARVLDTHSATEGGFAGTLRYMAPEVYAGQRAGAEADVFAWGAIMVFAATGEHAFRGGTLPEIAHRIRTHDPDLTTLPGALHPLVEAALAKDPLARPSARAILAALTGDPREGAGDLQDLVAAGAAQAGLRSRWEPGDPALGKVAEDAYAALPPREQSLVPEVFLRCVVPGEDGSLATRPVPGAELSDRDHPAEAHALEGVVRAFRPLLVVAGDRPDEQIVLARPAVLRAWPRLRRWVEADREGLGAHHRIRQAARTWAAHGRRRGDVLTGAHLDEAVRWATLADRRQSLNRLERGLLDASTRAQTSRSRRVRAVAAVPAVTTVVSLTATGWAIRAQRTSVDQRDIAASRQLAAQSRQFGGTAPDKAALLAVAAHGIRKTPESRAALLNIVADPARGVLSDYKGTPLSVTADRDGRLLAIGNEDGTIALWDVRRHRQIGGFLRLLTPSTFLGMSVALSPDGRTLAAAASDVNDAGDVVDAAVRLWDVHTRRPLGDLPVGALPRSVVFTSDGKSVAVDNGEEVGLWDIRTLRRRGPVVAHETNGDSDRYTVIDHSATTVATGEETGDGPSAVQLWDLATGRRTTSFPVKGKVVALSPNGRTVLTKKYSMSSDRFDVYLWDARTGRQQGGAIPLALGSDVGPFSPDGRVVVIGTQLWEAGGTHVGSIAADVGGALSVAAFAGEDTVVSLGGDGPTKAVRLWDVSVHQPDHRPFRVGRSEDDILHGLSADGRTLITDNGMSDGPPAFRTWDVTKRRETRPAVPMSADTARAPLAAPADEIVVAPDGRTFVTGNLYGQLRLWDPSAQRGFGLDGGPEGRISALAISPDGRILATGGGSQSQMSNPSVDGKVQLWDLRTRTLITKRPLFSSGVEVSALAFSPDGRTLAAGIGRTIRLWNVSDHKQLTPPISGINAEANVLAFGPGNRTLAIGAINTTVLLDVRDRRQIGPPLTGHSGPVTALAFNRDGTTLATGGDDQVVKLWEVTGQSQVGAPLVGHTGAVRSLVFNPDTTTLTTSDDKATVRRWNIAKPADHAAIAGSIAGRTLTRAEWTQYVAPGIDYRDICPSLSQGR
ncbi:protein kinase domain-containing protein [Actinomadura sp. 3N407]|uniref:protein kinase domain-containing protein n=1 Tax=Actinomadura sp. 3N407 TaxID=3457423 RepID=UPI003FCDEB1B